MKLRLLPVVALCVASSLACGFLDQKPELPPPPPPAPEEPPPAAPADGSIGVAACDDYVEKMTQCLAKMDPATRTSFEASFDHMRAAWRLAVTSPQGKAGLQAACTSALGSLASMPCNAPPPAVTPPATEKPTTTKSSTSSTTTNKSSGSTSSGATANPRTPRTAPRGQGAGRNR